ncbi:hypothetical protein A6A27_37280 [Micromonospora sp. CB01531]|nr:hypothetical protein A6A27_37280 [Micromonospora sp. CB01531]
MGGGALIGPLTGSDALIGAPLAWAGLAAGVALTGGPLTGGALTGGAVTGAPPTGVAAGDAAADRSASSRSSGPICCTWIVGVAQPGAGVPDGCESADPTGLP